MEQIKIGHDKTTGLYIIPNRNYCIINGSREKINTVYFNNTQVLITSIKPITYQTYSSKTIITHYEQDSHFSNILSVEDYKTQLEDLQSKGWKDDYEWFFDELEDEIKYKRFIKDLKPISKLEEVITDYEITFIEVPVSEYPEIQPIASMLDINSCEKAIFIYKPDHKRILSEYCDSLGLTYESNNDKKINNTYSWSNHSGIDYAKINGGYLFLGDNKIKSSQRTAKYDECVEALNKDKQFIKNAVDLFFRKIDGKKLSDIERGSYYKTLVSIQSSVRGLEVIKKSSYGKTLLLGKLTELIESVKII